ncbi:MAG: M42 family peptidase, partial [Clostridium sp.]|nr:M42 family peptidase [Clostridium sp.]
MLDLLKQLCTLPGVSGDEDQVRDFIRVQAAPWADEIRTDALGNLIVFKKGAKSTGNKLLLAAHMDEVGVIITRATKEGFLKFGFVG